MSSLLTAWRRVVTAEENISSALYAWGESDRAAAEAWYAANQSSVPEAQQELIRAGFIKLTKDQGPGKPLIYDFLPDP